MYSPISLLFIAVTVAGASDAGPSAGELARWTSPLDPVADRRIERELTMASRANVDVNRILKLAPDAPELPVAKGKTVKVATAAALKTAIETATDGTTILVADGVYSLDCVTLKGRHGVTIRSQSGNRKAVILDGNDLKKPAGERRVCIQVYGCHDFTIADMTIANYEYGLLLYGDGDLRRPLVHNMVFHNVWVRGVKGTHPQRIWDSPYDLATDEQVARTRPRDGRIQYCLFMCDIAKQDTEDGFGGDYISGIDMMWLKNWTVSDNVFANIRGHGGGGRGAIFIWVNSEDVVAERNIIVNCDRGIAFGNPSAEPPHMTRGIARNNFIVAGASQAIEFHQTRDSIACNNTVYGQDLEYRRTIEFQTGNTNVRFANNLVHGTMYMQENVNYQANVVGDLSGWFIDPAVGDLHLSEAATGAIGQAVPLVEVKEDFDRRPRKAKPDVGADELKR